MKVVFLDIDGVLRREIARPGVDGATAYKFSGFDPVCVGHLNAICRRTGASVVVSSSWKRNATAETLAAVLLAAGFLGNVCGRTPDLPGEVEHPGSMRGYEIAVWLGRSVALGARVESFVMLDDGAHTSGLAWLAAQLVQTTSTGGLQPEHVERAVALLGEVSR